MKEDCNDKDEISDVIRNRLLKLQDQSSKLEQLQLQLISIKNSNFMKKLESICAITIIQNDRIVLQLFIDNETEIAFNLFSTTNSSYSFEQRCYRIYKRYTTKKYQQKQCTHHGIY